MCSMRLLLYHLITCPSWREPKNGCLSWFTWILSCNLLVSSPFMIHTLSVVLHIQPVFCYLSSPTLINLPLNVLHFIYHSEPTSFGLVRKVDAFPWFQHHCIQLSVSIRGSISSFEFGNPQHVTAYMTESAVWRWACWMNKATASLCSLWNIVPSFFFFSAKLKFNERNHFKASHWLKPKSQSFWSPYGFFFLFFFFFFSSRFFLFNQMTQRGKTSSWRGRKRDRKRPRRGKPNGSCHYFMAHLFFFPLMN